MNSSHVITIECSDREEQEILMALLSDAGFDAFEQTSAALVAYSLQPVPPQDEMPAILLNYKWTSQVIEAENWNRVWESSFKPVMIGAFCGIRASFHPPIEAVRHEIVITPKMSFGTGHHATTWLMIDQLSTMNLANRSVLDFGTGTGVLAILAERLGADPVVAIDNDDWSIDNARENIEANHAFKVLLEKSEDLTAYSSFDIILANINKHVLLEQLPSIKQHLNRHGVVVFSGLLKGDRAEMVKSAEELEFRLIDAKEREGWICLTFAV